MSPSREDGAPGPAVLPGRPWPLGSTWDGSGVNFALFSAHAERVELCLFDADAAREVARVDLPECTDGVWHAYLPDARPGLVYGYRVHGPFQPEAGHRFNAHKLLLDPYARAFAGTFRWTDAHHGQRGGHGRGEPAPDRRDNAWACLKAVVRASDPPLTGHAPRTPWRDTVICEAHLKGFTMMNPDVPAHLRGTYAGFAHPASIRRLKDMGATAVELLPVQEFIDERMLAAAERVNYWGYNTLGFFAPAARYAGGKDPVTEFRAMVRALHDAGLEVILDVVYNHTAESDEHGPTLSFRGIDNASYYLHEADQPGRGIDLSGCGNTLDLARPRVMQMVLDSLRYWVDDMGVDGFRFDLATALARGPRGFEPGAAFLAAIRQDPVLARTKLIAEPWDVATWETGRFPAGFAEWNDRYRDAVRGFWLTGVTGCGELARRIAGSGDLFHHQRRAPQASINFVTAHDGFTLADLVSYERKHNHANGQDNADGSNDNRSTNCGIEGPAASPAVNQKRARLVRAMLTTLFVSQGVPMLPAGDDQGRTQDGNNNAYCQDNPQAWIDWDGADAELREYCASLVRLRAAHAAFTRTRWFDGSRMPTGDRDIAWLNAGGGEMTREHWDDASLRSFGFQLGRHSAEETAFVVLVNAHDEEQPFALPPPPGAAWRLVVDSASPGAALHVRHGLAIVPAHGLLVLASATTGERRHG